MKLPTDLPPVIALSGPTAAGKSGFAIALCERLGGRAEIVSVDSAQIYRGMDIGSAKPDAETRARVPHHLIDILDPAEAYSAARFADEATAVVAAIRARGRVPVLVGGTLLYFRALLAGLSDLPSADAATRRELDAERRRLGAEAQHARLAAVDPVTAARLHPNDAQRVQRALEIFQLSGRPASDWHADAKVAARLTGRVLRYAVRPPDKPRFDARITARFHAMIDAGLVGEVAALRARGDLHLDLPSMRAVGYRQIWHYLEGRCGLADAIQQGIYATRQYAKRQMTWLRGEGGWAWIDAEEPASLAAVLTALSDPPGR